MTEIAGISALALDGTSPILNQLGEPHTKTVQPTSQAQFEDILSAGLEAVNDKVANANDLVRQFAVDDNIPVHQVTLALEEARLSVELAMQVRARLVETYREMMNMQL